MPLAWRDSEVSSTSPMEAAAAVPALDTVIASSAAAGSAAAAGAQSARVTMAALAEQRPAGSPALGATALAGSWASVTTAMGSYGGGRASSLLPPDDGMLGGGSAATPALPALPTPCEPCSATALSGRAGCSAPGACAAGLRCCSGGFASATTDATSTAAAITLSSMPAALCCGGDGAGGSGGGGGGGGGGDGVWGADDWDDDALAEYRHLFTDPRRRTAGCASVAAAYDIVEEGVAVGSGEALDDGAGLAALAGEGQPPLAVISCASALEVPLHAGALAALGAHTLAVDMEDSAEPLESMRLALIAACGAIAPLRAAGHPVLVVCRRGMSRSVSAVVAWLLVHRRMTLRAAMERVRAVHPTAYPNIGFWQLLLALEGAVHGATSIPPAALRMHRAGREYLPHAPVPILPPPAFVAVPLPPHHASPVLSTAPSHYGTVPALVSLPGGGGGGGAGLFRTLS